MRANVCTYNGRHHWVVMVWWCRHRYTTNRCMRDKSHFPMHHLNHLIWESLYVSTCSSLEWCECRRRIPYFYLHLYHTLSAIKTTKQTKTRVKTFSFLVEFSVLFYECDEFNLWYTRSVKCWNSMIFVYWVFELFLKQCQKWCMHQVKRKMRNENRVNENEKAN